MWEFWLAYEKIVHSLIWEGLEYDYKVWLDRRDVILLTLAYNLGFKIQLTDIFFKLVMLFLVLLSFWRKKVFGALLQCFRNLSSVWKSGNDCCFPKAKKPLSFITKDLLIQKRSRKKLWKTSRELDRYILTIVKRSLEKSDINFCNTCWKGAQFYERKIWEDQGFLQ